MNGAIKSPQTFVSVYSGRQCLGHVINRGKAGFECFDVDDISLGIFATQREAAAALIDPAESNQEGQGT